MSTQHRSTGSARAVAAAAGRAGAGAGVRGSGGVGGFTLLEVTLALAATVVLGVGVLQVFNAVGTTVASGKRTSDLTAAAAALERQMRADFESMTRDGVLVIRGEYAQTGAPVRLAAGDPRPRPRRIDEVTFVAKGEFRSLYPNAIGRGATSDTAMIYYGHGLRRDASSAAFGSPLRRDDRLTDTTLVPDLGQPGTFAQNASEWVLARRATLLAQPSGATQDAVLQADGTAVLVADGEESIGGQPAAAHIFRRLIGPAGNRLGSGLIDVATTDLSQVRSVVMAATTANLDSGAIGGVDPAVDNQVPSVAAAQSLGAADSALRTVQEVQARMRELLPADSDSGRRMLVAPEPPNLLGTGGAQTTGERADQLMISQHVLAARCTEFIVEWSFGEVYTNPGDSSDPQNGRLIWYGLDRDVVDPDPTDATRSVVTSRVRRFPSVMTLTAGTERVYPQVTVNDGTQLYPLDSDPLDPSQPIRRETSGGAGASQPQPVVPLRWRDGTLAFRKVPSLLVGPLASGADDAFDNVASRAHYSYFGPFDPTFRPRVLPYDPARPADQALRVDPYYEQALAARVRGDGAPASVPAALRPMNPLVVDVNGNGVYEPGMGDALREPDTAEWKWPTMIRVTFSLADPTDPRVEQTFQFIFRVPSPRERATAL